jgi:SAM-dependent methyltransferase
VADPFCGYGSIPFSRLRYFPPAAVYASDIDAAALSYFRRKAAGATGTAAVGTGDAGGGKGGGGQSGRSLSIEKADAVNLDRRFPATLDAIITDPPWGEYGNGIDWKAFTGVIGRSLKPGGRAVVLCPRKGALEAEVLAAAGLESEAGADLLVGGKKARITVLLRR